MVTFLCSCGLEFKDRASLNKHVELGGSHFHEGAIVIRPEAGKTLAETLVDIAEGKRSKPR